MLNCVNLEVMAVVFKHNELSIGFSKNIKSKVFTFKRNNNQSYLSFIKWLQVGLEDRDTFKTCINSLVEDLFQKFDSSPDLPMHICNKNFFQDKGLADKVSKAEELAFDFLNEVIEPQLKELRGLFAKIAEQ